MLIKLGIEVIVFFSDTKGNVFASLGAFSRFCDAVVSRLEYHEDR